MKKLQRLLFLQGNKCFFCGDPIPEGEASVEHLDALSNGGKKPDENSVACCKAVNAVLGNLPVKEKLRAVLSHGGAFVCPMRAAHEPESKAREILAGVVENLRKRGAARPKTLATLRKTIAASFKQASPEVIDGVLGLLKENGYTAEDGNKVSYPGLRSGA